MAEYKIKDLETLTGIKAHTLRMWEKRYNLLSPERTTTKVREYSSSDLKKLLNIAILNDNGIKISKIAELSDQQIQQQAKSIYEKSNTVSTIVNLLIQAMIKMDTHTFEQILDNTIQKEGLEFVFKNHVISFLDRIGVLWMVNTITPLQEHFVSNLIRQKIIAETDKIPSIEKRRIDAVLFTPEGELHEISLLFYNYMLKKDGFKTLYLGASLPIENLKSCLDKINPKNVIVSIVANTTKEDYFYFMDKLTKEIKLPTFIGGAIVDQFGLPKTEFVFPIQDWIGN